MCVWQHRGPYRLGWRKDKTAERRGSTQLRMKRTEKEEEREKEKGEGKGEGEREER